MSTPRPRLCSSSALLLLLSVAACSSPDEQEAPCEGEECELVGSNSITLGTVDGPGVCPDPNDGDPLTVESAEMNGDVLTVEVTYGGGCADHSITACWINTGCATSDPPQTGLALVHDAGGDSCKALVSETLTYDLSPMRDCATDRVFVELVRHDVSVEYVVD